MTTPSSQFLPQLLLRLQTVLLLLLGAASDRFVLAAGAEQQSTITRPGCRDKCGNISIPFPFGIGPGCFHEGFEVFCNDSAPPPRAFLTDKRVVRSLSRGYETSSLPLELVSISLAESEARAYGMVSYACSPDSINHTIFSMVLENTSFTVSARNVLIGVGWGVEPVLLTWPPNPTTPVYYRSAEKIVCRTDHPEYSPDMESATNGSCAGQGCCEATLPPKYSAVEYITMFNKVENNTMWNTSSCDYSMLVEKSWYSFSTLDLYGDMVLPNRFPQGVPYVIDFAIGNGSCPVEGRQPPSDHACVSDNSLCANTGIGYVCKCRDNYDGNPYITNGCQDIDECKLPELYPCSSHGICKNRQGGYDCPCKFGMKGDGKAGTCIDIFPLVAQVSVGIIGGILLMAVLSFLIILRKEKRKLGELYKKNGGPTLEKANIIKLYKKGELKPIIKNNNLIGKGGFGEVYKGVLDNKLVAVKKPISGSVLENEQFADEVMVQSQVIHKNIVRLIGCCLEVDIPMLVYEFISQGSLQEILHNNNNKVALDLDARLSIATQSADGLAYMHSKTNVKILHGDVKPANILLDDNFVAKISDFGISRLIVRDKNHTETVIGDVNYMDPIYLQKGLLTEKSDVYSFGVVILELISRRQAIRSDTNGLVNSFLEAHEKQTGATELFDKEIATIENLEVLDSLAGMAMECLSLDLDQRPTMAEVAERLLILSRSHKSEVGCH